jgi:hypothetical protein
MTENSSDSESEPSCSNNYGIIKKIKKENNAIENKKFEWIG